MCSLVLLSSFNKNNYIRLKVDSNMSSVYGYYFFFIAFSRVRVFNFLNIYICMRCLHLNMIRLKVEYMRKKKEIIFDSIQYAYWLGNGHVCTISSLVRCFAQKLYVRRITSICVCETIIGKCGHKKCCVKSIRRLKWVSYGL